MSKELETDRVYDFKLNEKGIKEVVELKTVFSEFQSEILGRMIPSREKSIVKTKLEEAGFYATRAVSQNPENYIEINTY